MHNLSALSDQSYISAFYKDRSGVFGGGGAGDEGGDGLGVAGGWGSRQTGRVKGQLLGSISEEP